MDTAAHLRQPDLMRSRQDGMWWGPAIEAPDPAALARFYAALLEWPVVHEEPGTAVVGVPGGSFLVFQQASDYVAPVWPPVAGRQRPMVHLDFQVGDLESAQDEAVALGATVAAEQPNGERARAARPRGPPVLPLSRRRLSPVVQPTIYEAVGGAQALLDLAHAWHRRCLADPVVSHAFSHPGQHPGAHGAAGGVLGGGAGRSGRRTRGASATTATCCGCTPGRGEHQEMDERARACFAPPSTTRACRTTSGCARR